MSTTAHPDRTVVDVCGRSVLVAGATSGSVRRSPPTWRPAHARGARPRTLGSTRVARSQVALDLRDPDACELAVAATTHHAGQLDVVFNAVGVEAFGPVDELSVDVMEELFMTDTFVPIMLAKAALTAMSEGRAIVNISGVIAEQALTREAR